MNNFNRQLFYKERNYTPEFNDNELKTFFSEVSNKYMENSDSDDEVNEDLRYEKI